MEKINLFKDSWILALALAILLFLKLQLKADIPWELVLLPIWVILFFLIVWAVLYFQTNSKSKFNKSKDIVFIRKVSYIERSTMTAPLVECQELYLFGILVYKSRSYV